MPGYAQMHRAAQKKKKQKEKRLLRDRPSSPDGLNIQAAQRGEDRTSESANSMGNTRGIRLVRNSRNAPPAETQTRYVVKNGMSRGWIA